MRQPIHSPQRTQVKRPMMRKSTQAPAASANKPNSTMDPAELLAKLETSMEDLIRLIQEETALVRQGRLWAAAKLEKQKTAETKSYLQLIEHVRAQQDVLTERFPEMTATLRNRHDEFRTMLESNLSALKTARDVTKNIIQNVAKKVGQTEAPKPYGYGGTYNTPAPTAGHGLTLDRSL